MNERNEQGIHNGKNNQNNKRKRKGTDKRITKLMWKEEAANWKIIAVQSQK